MKNQAIELLINTKSKRGQRALIEIRQACRELDLHIDKINEIESGVQLHPLLKRIKKRAPKVLIVGSGDGTVSDAVDYLAGSEIVLGVVPLGTTNNFARSLGLPISIYESLKVIKQGKIMPIDLGRIENDYFSNIAGVGLSARIAGRVTNERKKRYGRLAYPLTGLELLFRHKPFFVTVTDKDGELQFHFETHQLIIANGRYHAGKEIAADASLEGNELIIFKLGGRSKVSFVWHMLDFYLGRRRSVYHSSYLIGKDVTIHTSTPQPIELDGEVKLKTPVAAMVRPKAVKVFHSA